MIPSSGMQGAAWQALVSVKGTAGVRPPQQTSEDGQSAPFVQVGLITIVGVPASPAVPPLLLLVFVPLLLLLPLPLPLPLLLPALFPLLLLPIPVFPPLSTGPPLLLSPLPQAPASVREQDTTTNAIDLFIMPNSVAESRSKGPVVNIRRTSHCVWQ